MNFREVYKTLEQNKYHVFSYEDILLFYPQENKDNLKKLIYRWKKQGWIYALKRGMYELVYPQDFNVPDFYIANKLYGPSYVSLEAALSNYSIIPEVSMAVTSIATKPTRRFKNKHGLFIYRTVKPQAFSGYYVEKQGGFDILMAEPEKAVIDYIYFKKYRSKGNDYAQDRMEKNILKKLDRRKMEKYARLYSLDLKDFYAYL